MSNAASGESLEHCLETLRRIVNTLGPQRSLHSSLRGLLRTLAERHPFLRPHLVIYDPEARTLRLCLADTPPRDESLVYEPGFGITGQVFTLGRPVIVERIADNTVFQNKFFTRTPEEMSALAFLSVPVYAQSADLSEGAEVLGVLSVDTPTAPKENLDTRCRFLEVVAGLIGHQVSYLQAEMSRHQRVAPLSGQAPGPQDPSRAVVAVSKSLRHILAQVLCAAGSRVAVLFCGEPGTGKELLAAVLHKAGARAEMPLVRVNCVTFSPGSQEAALFGVQKGSLPGALQTRKGLLEEAHRGSLYLNGVELLPQPVQARLLRAMQEHELTRVGGDKPVEVDVRIICATQRSQQDLLRQGALRQDLLQRLLGLAITVPPLREHSEDILPLAEHFLQQATTAQGKTIRRISPPAVDLLLRYPWPGNVSELKNCVERAVAACEEDAIRAWHLPPSLQTEEDREPRSVNFSEAVARFEQELLTDALQKARGNMLEASRLLDASYRIINYKVKKYGLDPKKFVGR